MKATKTIAAIDAALESDQGNTWRGLMKDTVPFAADVYRSDEDGERAHLGASLIGRECSRELWYTFRWVTKKNFDGRMLRLFNRGHLEEPRVVALLRLIGVQVWQHDENGKQFRIVGHKGHFGGSCDGVGVGIPDFSPNTPALLEFKTHGEKSFDKVASDGVALSKFEHYVQMQVYMHKMNLNIGLYTAVNKNTDALHMEIVQLDAVAYSRAEAKSIMIIDTNEAPPRISNSPAWHKCKMCDHHAVCHKKDLPQKNCRTCGFSTAVDNGEWYCNIASTVIPLEVQRTGCPQYQMNPSIKAK